MSGRAARAPRHDLRSHLALLEAEGLLASVDTEVDVRHQIAAYIRTTSDEDGPALYFRHVRGYAHPVVGGLYATRRLGRVALGVETNDEAMAVYREALAHPVEPKPVRGQAACQEVVRTGGAADLLTLPVPTYSELDSGPYLTLGAVITRDPDTGIPNMSIYRLQVKGPNRLGLFHGDSQDVAQHLHKARDRGQPLPVAVALGVGPDVIYAAQAKVPYGISEMALSGGFSGQPLAVARARTVDLDVPAEAEIVIEGTVAPDRLEPEGIFGEVSGYYGPAPQTPIIEVTALTHRRDPIFQAALTGMPMTENHVLREIPLKIELLHVVRRVSPNVHDVNLLEGGTASFVAVVSMTPRRPLEARAVLLAALGTKNRHKIVIVCDEDIDITDVNDVLWAVTTRVNPAGDLVIIDNAPVHSLDPSSQRGRGSLLGIDATRPFGRDFPAKVRVPGAAGATLAALIPDWVARHSG